MEFFFFLPFCRSHHTSTQKHKKVDSKLFQLLYLFFFFWWGWGGRQMGKKKKIPLQNKENKLKQTKTKSGVEKFMQQKILFNWLIL